MIQYPQPSQRVIAILAALTPDQVLEFGKTAESEFGRFSGSNYVVSAAVVVDCVEIKMLRGETRRLRFFEDAVVMEDAAGKPIQLWRKDGNYFGRTPLPEAARYKLIGYNEAGEKIVDYPRCGHCDHWMKSTDCPKEHNVNGWSRGPSCEGMPCSKFIFKSGYASPTTGHK
jgi:hypothetical protein